MDEKFWNVNTPWVPWVVRKGSCKLSSDSKCPSFSLMQHIHRLTRGSWVRSCCEPGQSVGQRES